MLKISLSPHGFLYFILSVKMNMWMKYNKDQRCMFVWNKLKSVSHDLSDRGLND